MFFFSFAPAPASNHSSLALCDWCRLTLHSIHPVGFTLEDCQLLLCPLCLHCEELLQEGWVHATPIALRCVTATSAFSCLQFHDLLIHPCLLVRFCIASSFDQHPCPSPPKSHPTRGLKPSVVTVPLPFFNQFGSTPKPRKKGMAPEGVPPQFHQHPPTCWIGRVVSHSARTSHSPRLLPLSWISSPAPSPCSSREVCSSKVPRSFVHAPISMRRDLFFLSLLQGLVLRSSAVRLICFVSDSHEQRHIREALGHSCATTILLACSQKHSS